MKTNDPFRLVDALLEAAPDAIVVSDAAGKIMYVSNQVAELFGYEKSELLGSPVDRLIPERYRAAHPEHRRRYFGAPRARPMGAGGLALFGLRKDGTEFPAEISLSPLQTDQGPVAITAIRDTTHRMLAEEQRTQLAQAQEALRLRDEFLSIASHDLKTPLTALQLDIDALLRPPNGAPAGLAGHPSRDQLVRVKRSITRLTTLVDRLLDVARITSGRLTLEREQVNVGEVVDEILLQLESEIERAGCDVQRHGGRDAYVWGDAVRVSQILSNLLSNAIKYGPGKPIEILVKPDGGMVSITVRDHGIGIRPEDQKRIFERFERIVSSKHYGGVGLGLWIVRQIVEAHGGHVKVWSAPNAGSTFTVALPASAAVPVAENVHGANTGDALPERPDVLLVDDDVEIRESLGDLLRLENVTCVAADGGEAALKLLRNGLRPRMILLDLMMPQMDGWTFREHQRKDQSIANIPVAVVSAMQDLDRRASTFDAVALFRKPIDVDALLRTIRAQSSKA